MSNEFPTREEIKLFSDPLIPLAADTNIGYYHYVFTGPDLPGVKERAEELREYREKYDKERSSNEQAE